MELLNMNVNGQAFNMMHIKNILIFKELVKKVTGMSGEVIVF